MYKPITKCRACQSTNLIKVFDLGTQPLANDFALPDGERQGCAPLEVLYCQSCTLGQLSVVVDPELLYRNYAYVTSQTQTMHEHFDLLLKDITSRNMASNLCEIGSNDGTFLRHSKSYGINRVVGIDPADNLRPNMDVGLTSINMMFDPFSAMAARKIVPEGFDVVVARHVFAHIDNWEGFVCALDLLCHDRSLVFIEAPYVADMLEGVEFDTVYHEHLSYITLKSIDALLKDTPFQLYDAIRYSIHGGAYGLILRRRSFGARSPEMDALVAAENIDLQKWRRFSHNSHTKIREMKYMVQHIRKVEGKTVCGFGASAKSTVWMNACGFTRDDVHFITDTTPFKQGRLSPGTNVEVVTEDQLLVRSPHYALMFAWNFKAEIFRNQRKFMEHGGKFLVPELHLEEYDATRALAYAQEKA